MSARCPLCNQTANVTRTRRQNMPTFAHPTDAPDLPPIVLHTREYTCTNPDCGVKFISEEYIRPPSFRVLVERSDGHLPRYDPFDMEKLRDSLRMACSRKISERDIWRLANLTVQILRSERFEKKRSSSEEYSGVYTSKQIGEAVLMALIKERYVAAWIRYALVFYDLLDEKDAYALFTKLQERMFEHTSAVLEYNADKMRREREEQ